MNGVSVLVQVDQLGTLRTDLSLNGYRAAWVYADDLAFHGRDAAAWRALAAVATACAEALDALAQRAPVEQNTTVAEGQAQS